MRVLWWGVCVWAALGADVASAQVREVAHEVTVSARGQVARYAVRRSFHNEGERAALELVVRTPHEAVATGLRVVAGPAASLEWAGEEALTLRLEPLGQDELATVEYTLMGPLALRYPAGEVMGVSERAPVVLRIEASSGERAWLNGVPAPLKTPLDAEKIGASGDVLSVQIGEASEALAGRFGVARGGGAVLVDVGLEAPRRLSELPKQAAVVFVLDASWSMGERGIAAQLEVVRAYMGHVPDARVEIVVARRGAERLFGRFVAADVLASALEQAPRVAPGHGSALDAGVELAASVLGREGGERRLVVLSDGALPAGRDLAGAMQRLDPGVVAHGVVVAPLEQGRGSWLRRVPSPQLGALARGGGIVVELGVGRWGLTEEVLELVRPTRVDALRWSLGDAPLRALREGASWQMSAWVSAAPATVEVTGLLWDRPVRLVARRKPSLDALAAAAALWTGGDLTLRRAVATGARIVAPWASLRAASGRGRLVQASSRRGLGSGRSMAWPLEEPRRHLAARLPSVVERVHKACAAQHAAVGPVVLRLYVREVELERVEVERGAGALVDCVVEGLWSLERLPGVGVGDVSYSFGG